MSMITDLFDLSHTILSEDLNAMQTPWEALLCLHDLILKKSTELCADYIQQSKEVWIHKSAVVSPSACIQGPCIVGPNTEIRHCALIRGNVLIGANCTIGHAVELKNDLLFDEVKVPHLNYVGDSILGYRAHMGAGSITSNLKLDQSSIGTFDCSGKCYNTGMRKYGAMLGDYSEIGCNSVLFPGAVVGRNTAVYPLSCVRGYVPCGSIFKSGNLIVSKE